MKAFTLFIFLFNWSLSYAGECVNYPTGHIELREGNAADTYSKIYKDKPGQSESYPEINGVRRHVLNVDRKGTRYQIQLQDNEHVIHGEEPSEKYVLTFVNNKLQIYTITTGKKSFEIDLKGDFGNFTFSNDGRILIHATTQGTISLYDATKGFQLLHEFNLGMGVVQTLIPSNQNQILLVTKESQAVLYDFSLKKIVAQTDSKTTRVRWIAPSPMGKYLVGTSSGMYDLGYFTLFDTALNPVKKLTSVKGLQFSEDEKRLVYYQSQLPDQPNSAGLNVFDLEKNRLLYHLATLDPSLAVLNNSDQLVLSFDRQELLVNFLQTCVTPKPIGQAEAQALLSRIQQTKKFIIERDLAELTYLLEYRRAQVDPKSLTTALLYIFQTSELLFDELTHRYPDLLQLTPAANLDFSPDAETLVNVKKYLEILIAREGPRTEFKTWAQLALLRPLLKRLSAADKDNYLYRIGSSVTASAVDQDFYKGIFHSKILWLVENALGPYFGEPFRMMTDMAVVRKADLISIYILGSHAIDDDPATWNLYGFFIQPLNQITLDQALMEGSVVHNQSYQWKQADKTFLSRLKLSIGKKQELVVKADRPPYSELMNNNELNGIVAISPGISIHAKVLSSYQDYYQNNLKYTLEPPQEVNNFSDFLQRGIESGKIGYFLKEAHSDGDERNLFKMPQKVLVQKGQKRNSRGKIDTVYLVSAKRDSMSTMGYIANAEFGAWIRNRERNGFGSILYLNTSCWSYTKAVNEIEAAHTAKLIEIPGTSVMNTFRNSATSGLFQVLNGFLNFNSYSEIRSALEKNAPKYKNRKEDLFIFPDEDAYAKYISDVIRIPLVQDIQIYGPDGKPYTMVPINSH